MTRNTYAQLPMLCQLWPSPYRTSLPSDTYALVPSNLDYCNSPCVRLPLKTLQNAMAHVDRRCGLRRYNSDLEITTLVASCFPGPIKCVFSPPVVGPQLWNAVPIVVCLPALWVKTHLFCQPLGWGNCDDGMNLRTILCFCFIVSCAEVIVFKRFLSMAAICCLLCCQPPRCLPVKCGVSFS